MKNLITSCLAFAYFVALAACGGEAPPSFVGAWSGSATTDLTCPATSSDAVNNASDSVTITDAGNGTFIRAVGPFGSGGAACLIPLDARGKLVRITRCDVQGDGSQFITITSWSFVDNGATAAETGIGTFDDTSTAPPSSCVFSYASALRRAP